MGEVQEQQDDGLTARIILVMATEMAAMKRNTERACIMFHALAESVGVSVAHVFAETAED